MHLTGYKITRRVTRPVPAAARYQPRNQQERRRLSPRQRHGVSEYGDHRSSGTWQPMGGGHWGGCRAMWSSPCRSGKRGLRGDIPKHSFGVNCPLWNPHLPLQLPPRKPSSTWWGPPSAGTAGGLMAPTSRTLGKRGQVSPALGQQVPTLSPARWPAQGRSMERGQGKVGGGKPSVPTAANTPAQGHLSWPWSHPWEAGTGRARSRPSQVSRAHGLGIGSPLPSAGLQRKGPTSTQSWQHPECPGAGAFSAARRGQAQCPPRTGASEPWAPPALCSGRFSAGLRVAVGPGHQEGGT